MKKLLYILELLFIIKASFLISSQITTKVFLWNDLQYKIKNHIANFIIENTVYDVVTTASSLPKQRQNINYGLGAVATCFTYSNKENNVLINDPQKWITHLKHFPHTERDLQCYAANSVGIARKHFQRAYDINLAFYCGEDGVTDSFYFKEVYPKYSFSVKCLSPGILVTTHKFLTPDKLRRLIVNNPYFIVHTKWQTDIECHTSTLLNYAVAWNDYKLCTLLVNKGCVADYSTLTYRGLKTMDSRIVDLLLSYSASDSFKQSCIQDLQQPPSSFTYADLNDILTLQYKDSNVLTPEIISLSGIIPSLVAKLLNDIDNNRYTTLSLDPKFDNMFIHVLRQLFQRTNQQGIAAQQSLTLITKWEEKRSLNHLKDKTRVKAENILHHIKEVFMKK